LETVRLGLIDLFLRWLNPPATANAPAPNARLSASDIEARLGLSVDSLRGIAIDYQRFSIPKRGGGQRFIDSPSPELKTLQRTLLKKLLNGLKTHRNSYGVERGRSIAHHASRHTGQAVVVNLDIKDFFGSTTDARINAYFRAIGWPSDIADLLTKVCAHQGGLPQGAPTSPRLSNLVNYRLDERLTRGIEALGGVYTRYADDMTISFKTDSQQTVNKAIGLVELTVKDEGGYSVHQRRKRHVRRRHQRQQVTGLVVNDSVNLPRETRKKLRAVKHHLDTGKPASMSKAEYDGWLAYYLMVLKQSEQAQG
jgi:hypothetical protein